MTQGARSRDRRSIPVEGEFASGAADPFDGNHTNQTAAWIFEFNVTDEDLALMLGQLMEYTAFGHMAWVVFPRAGFRID